MRLLHCDRQRVAVGSAVPGHWSGVRVLRSLLPSIWRARAILFLWHKPPPPPQFTKWLLSSLMVVNFSSAVTQDSVPDSFPFLIFTTYVGPMAQQICTADGIIVVRALQWCWVLHKDGYLVPLYLRQSSHICFASSSLIESVSAYIRMIRSYTRYSWHHTTSTCTVWIFEQPSSNNGSWRTIYCSIWTSSSFAI